MRILQVSNGYPHRAYGGVELHTYRLSNALAARGHAVSVFTRLSDPTRADGTVVDEIVDGLVVRSIVNDFKEARFRDHYLCPPLAREFHRTLEETRPEVVHFQHLIGLSADLPQIARAQGARVVGSILDYWYVCQRVMFQHRDGTACGGPAERSCIECVLGEHAPVEARRKRVARGLRTLLSRKPACGPAENVERFEALRAAIGTYEKIDTCAQFVVDLFSRHRMPLPADRTRVIALPIDRDRFEAPRAPVDLPVRAQRPLRVGFIGHALHHKGPHVLLEALALLPDRPIQVSLWGVRHPDHPYDARLEELLMHEPRARHHGRFAEGGLPGVLADVDVLAVPSTCIESYGLATREAFAAGRPVVTTDRGALPESVRPGVDGLIVPAQDPGALANALARLLDEEGLLDTLIRGALESGARTKSMDAYAAEIEDFLYA